MTEITPYATRVKCQLPGPRSRELFERWERVEAQCAGYQAAVVWDRARGVEVNGRRRKHVSRLDLGRSGHERMRREKLADNAARIGESMMTRLVDMKERCRYVGDVRGRGLVMGNDC